MHPEPRIVAALLMVLDALEHTLAYTQDEEPWEAQVARRALADARDQLGVFRPQYDAEALMWAELLKDGDDGD